MTVPTMTTTPYVFADLGRARAYIGLSPTGVSSSTKRIRSPRDRRQNARTNLRQFGAFHKEPGNLCLMATAWWGWEDSNFQPNGYCRDTSEPGLAALIYRRSGRGSCTRCSVFLRADRSFRPFRAFS
jgi:hypothetical protein